MHEEMKQWEGTPYPDMIRNCPEIDIPIRGIRGWMLQGEKKQIVFFDIEPVGEIPPHAHRAQWGVVIQGEMLLTIAGKTKTYRKGDWYFIHEDEIHSATFPKRVQVMDFFDAPDRYRTKPI